MVTALVDEGGPPGGQPVAALRQQRHPAGAWLGLLVAAQLFVSEELALPAAFAGLLIVAMLAAGHPRRVSRAIGPAAAGAAAGRAGTAASAASVTRSARRRIREGP